MESPPSGVIKRKVISLCLVLAGFAFLALLYFLKRDLALASFVSAIVILTLIVSYIIYDLKRKG